MSQIRSATASDQPTIRAMIRKAGLNPVSLDWPRFLVAEEAGRVVGIGQIKPHSDGSRELASLAVLPEYQGTGIGSQLVQALLANESGAVYLSCVDRLEGYYTRFGFQREDPAQLPPIMKRIYFLGNGLMQLVALIGKSKHHLLVMKRLKRQA